MLRPFLSLLGCFAVFFMKLMREDVVLNTVSGPQKRLVVMLYGSKHEAQLID